MNKAKTTCQGIFIFVCRTAVWNLVLYFTSRPSDCLLEGGFLGLPLPSN